MNGDSPFKHNALRFAQQNRPGNTLFQAFLSSAAANDLPTATTLANLLVSTASLDAAAGAAPLMSSPAMGLLNSGGASLDPTIGISDGVLNALIKQAQAAAALQQQQAAPLLPAPLAASISSSVGTPLSGLTSSSSTPVFDGVFRVPELPIARRQKGGCIVCGLFTNQHDGGPLMECETCRSAAYCSQEHRNFDHKRHKLMCRTYQMRTSKSLVNGPTGRAEAMDCSVSPSIAINHHRLQTATSTMSLSAASSSSSALGFDGASNPSATPSAPPSDRRSLDSAVGGDEEIQVIEESSSPRKPRKRPYAADEPCPHPKGWKDHSRNLLFKDTLQEHMKNLAKTGVAVNQHQAIALRLKYIAEHVIRSLNEYGWAVVDNFLGKAHCRYTYREVEELYERGLFREGQLVEGKEPDPATSAKDIRSDKIYWFDSAECRAQDAVTIRLLVSMIDSVIVHFSKRIPPYSIGGRSRAMIACYPGSGTRYVKHVDNPIRDGRCITSIYYCNDDWLLSRDGGTLRLYPETSQVPMDIDPQADRLVFFWSDHRNPHEVLPVFRPRYAITIWYFDESEKKEALERQRAEDQKNASRPSTASERVHSLLNRAEINSAPIPEKPRTPPRPMAVPVRSAKPEMQWRPSARVVADDQASTSTRSLIDDEDELVEVVDAADEAERDGKFVPNFEV